MSNSIRSFILALPFLCLLSCSTTKSTTTVVPLFEKGETVNGKKVGVWEYYNAGKVELKVDYTTKAIVYQIPDSSNFAILTDTGWEMSKLDIYPTYLGSKRDFLHGLYTNLNYPLTARQDKIVGTVLLGFEVNEVGKPRNVRVIKDIGSGCGEEVFKAFNAVQSTWIVARIGDVKYNSRFVMPVRFELSDHPKSNIKTEEVKALKDSLERNSPNNMIDEIVVTGSVRLDRY